MCVGVCVSECVCGFHSVIGVDILVVYFANPNSWSLEHDPIL